MSEPHVTEGIARLREMIRTSHRIVVFTGAGISTESGIPDFRGPNGVWKTQTPIDFNDFVGSEAVRAESWQRKFGGDSKLENSVPNVGHHALTSLVEAGKITHIITQNVDGLHQKSGTPDDQVIELHGNASYATCLDCSERYELAPLKAALLRQLSGHYQNGHDIVWSGHASRRNAQGRSSHTGM